MALQKKLFNGIDELTRKILQSQFLSEFLMRLKNFHLGVGKTFYPYIQPVIVLAYALFLLMTFYIMRKKKMIGVFQGIFLLSNFFEVLAPLLEAVLIIVFYHVADPSVPMPFPWCAIYIHNLRTMKTLVHLIASYLNIILGINRLCAVYVPFKMNRLFSRKRAILYCCISICGCTMLSCAVHFALPSVATKTWVDDVWGSNKVQFYTACSLDEASYPSNEGYEMQIVEMIFYILPSFCLVAMSIIMVKKLRSLSSVHEHLHEASNQNQNANRRIYAMNRVAVWVFLSFLTTQLPLLIIKLYGFYTNMQFYINGNMGKVKGGNFSNNEVQDVIFECLMPVDLIIYFLLSKKLRMEMKISIKKLFTCYRSN